MEFRVGKNLNCGEDRFFGHIYYSQPDQREIKAALHRISELCRARARELYGESEIVEKRLTSELRFLDETDSAFHIAVLKEIADLSKEEQSLMLCAGYGPLLIEYLLGASPINPLPPHYHCDACRSVEFSSAAEDGFDLPRKNCPRCGKALHRDGHNCEAVLQQFDHQGRRKWPYIAVKLSSDVIGKLQRRLDSRLCDAGERSRVFCDIEVQSLPQSKKLKRLSETTGVKSVEIELDDGSVWAQVAKDIYEETMRDLTLPDDITETAKEAMHLPENAEGEPDVSLHDLIRICGFHNATFSNRFEIPELKSPTCYLTKDDIFDALLANGFPPDRAAVMTRRIAWGHKRELDYVPSAIKGNMYIIENLWTRCDCLSKAVYRYLLKWYELRYPRGYQKACEELEAE